MMLDWDEQLHMYLGLTTKVKGYTLEKLFNLSNKKTLY